MAGHGLPCATKFHAIDGIEQGNLSWKHGCCGRAARCLVSARATRLSSPYFSDMYEVVLQLPMFLHLVYV